jgi:hypothetical protein
MFHLVNGHRTGFTIGETHLAWAYLLRSDNACAVMGVKLLLVTTD